MNICKVGVRLVFAVIICGPYLTHAQSPFFTKSFLAEVVSVLDPAAFFRATLAGRIDTTRPVVPVNMMRPSASVIASPPSAQMPVMPSVMPSSPAVNQQTQVLSAPEVIMPSHPLSMTRGQISSSPQAHCAQFVGSRLGQCEAGDNSRICEKVENRCLKNCTYKNNTNGSCSQATYTTQSGNSVTYCNQRTIIEAFNLCRANVTYSYIGQDISCPSWDERIPCARRSVRLDDGVLYGCRIDSFPGSYECSSRF